MAKLPQHIMYCQMGKSWCLKNLPNFKEQNWQAILGRCGAKKVFFNPTNLKGGAFTATLEELEKMNKYTSKSLSVANARLVYMELKNLGWQGIDKVLLSLRKKHRALWHELFELGAVKTDTPRALAEWSGVRNLSVLNRQMLQVDIRRLAAWKNNFLTKNGTKNG